MQWEPRDGRAAGADRNHAEQGRVGAAERAHAMLFGAAYVLLAAMPSIPSIALAAGYPAVWPCRLVC